MPDEKWPVEMCVSAPTTPGDVRRNGFAWFPLHDGIHRRGQFSMYLRMVGMEVRSTYGPTLDEP